MCAIWGASRLIWINMSLLPAKEHYIILYMSMVEPARMQCSTSSQKTTSTWKDKSGVSQPVCLFVWGCWVQLEDVQHLVQLLNLQTEFTNACMWTWHLLALISSVGISLIGLCCTKPWCSHTLPTNSPQQRDTEGLGFDSLWIIC